MADDPESIVTFFVDDNPIAQLPDETDKAYDAFLRYLNMGPERTIAAVARQINKHATQLKDWATDNRWVERVRQHNAQVAREAQKRATEDYLKDVQEHRDRYMRTGKELHALSRALLGKVAEGLNNGDIPINTGTLNTVARCFQLSVDLEAHALSLDKLMTLLDTDEHSQES